MQLVYGVVGAVVGYFVGGPQGAYYGFVIGYSIGSVIESSNQKMTTEGPRLSDLRVTISSYGAFIPRVFVRGKISGNIYECSDLVPTEHTTETDAGGGKGGPTAISKTTTYAVSMLVGLCKSNGDRGVARIWANNKLIWSRDPLADASLLLATAGTVGQVIVYDGRDSQLPDPTLEALYGIGHVPAYLGELTVMFVDFQLANYSNNVAATQLLFEVLQFPIADTEDRVLNQNDGVFAVYSKKAIYEAGGTGLLAHSYVDSLDGLGLQDIGAFVTSDRPLAVLKPKLDEPGVCYFDFGRASEADGPVRSSNALFYLMAPLKVESAPCVVAVAGVASIRFYNPVGRLKGFINVLSEGLVGNQPGGFVGTGIFGPDVNGDPVSATYRYLAAEDEGKFVFSVARRQNGSTASVHLYRSVLFGSAGTDDGGFVIAAEDELILGLRVLNGAIFVAVQKRVGSTQTFDFLLRKYDYLGSLIATFAGPTAAADMGAASLFVVAGSVVVVQTGYARFKFSPSGTLTMLNTTSPGTEAGTSAGHGYGTLYYESDDFSIVTGAASVMGPGGPSAYLQRTNTLRAPSITNNAIAVREIIRSLCAEKGVTALDFTRLPASKLCQGVTFTRQSSVRTAVDYMRDNYRIDIAEAGNQIKFILRGGAPVDEWTMDDLGAYEGSGDPPAALTWQEADELGLPAQIVLTYSDRNNSYDQGAVIARRETALSQEAKTLDCTALALTGDEAQAMVEQALVDARIARSTYKISTNYSKEQYETGDVITLPGETRKRRGRVQRKTDKGAPIEWEFVEDDAGAMTQYVIGGAPATGRDPQVDAAIPRSFAEVLNLPSLQPDDDNAGYYALGAPLLLDGRYQGLELFASPAAPRSLGTLSARGGLRGFATTALGSSPMGYFDEGSGVTVSVPNGFIPASIAKDDVLAGRGIYLFGSEIIGVCRWAPLGGKLYRARGLLRGLRGTEWAIGSHTVGEDVLELSAFTLLRDVSIPPAAPVSLAAVSLGRSIADADTVSDEGTNTAEALRPFAPIFFRKAIRADGFAQFQVERRSRKRMTTFMNVAPYDDATPPDVVLQISDTVAFAQIRREIVAVPQNTFDYLAVLTSTDEAAFAAGGLPSTLYARAVERSVASSLESPPTAVLSFTR